MAKSEISLVPGEVKKARVQEGQEKAFNAVALTIFAVGILGAALVFSLALVFKARIKSLNVSVEAERAKIASYAEVEKSVGILEKKGLAVGKILEARPYYSKLLTTLGEITPQDITIRDFTLLAEDKVGVNGEALNYVTIAQFLRAVADPAAGGSIFTGAELTSVSLESQTGIVRFAANLVLKEGGLKE